jgi:Ca2+-binding EF-hand superfamily protein
MCLNYDINDEELDFQSFIAFLNEHLGDCSTRSGVSKVFARIMDEELNEITPETLHKIIQECGDNLSLEDVKKIMTKISEPSDEININSEEFYYIMTKKPADVEIISSVTKPSKS